MGCRATISAVATFEGILTAFFLEVGRFRVGVSGYRHRRMTTVFVEKVWKTLLSVRAPIAIAVLALDVELCQLLFAVLGQLTGGVTWWLCNNSSPTDA